MSQPLRVLLIEDSDDDARLLERELRRGGYEPAPLCRVQSAPEMAAALAAQDFDLVVCDYSLPRLSAPEAIEVLRQSAKDIPLIIVSGTVSEDIAVECLKCGASDFMSKAKLARLAPAIARELREAEARRQQRRATEVLVESDERNRLLYEALPFPTFLFDSETLAMTDVNEAALRFYGFARGEFLRLRLSELWLADEVEERFERLVLMGEAIIAFPQVRQRRRDGSIVHVDVVSHALTLGGRRVRLSVMSDVTERVALEERLRQSQKMEAVGQLAGGVAHDFNNLLAVIIANAELLDGEFPAADGRRAGLDEIRGAANRAAALTRQLLAFSRQQILRPTVLELNVVVAGIESMLRRTMGADITLVTELDPALGHIRADSTQLEQILVNLVVNARDAMPHGGTIVIRTQNLAPRPSQAEGDPSSPAGGYVSLSVTDDGTGMDAATRARVFEPFFTTKPVGQGTGLGLATVHGIVHQSGGQLTVDSAPGAGACFTVCLPRVNEAVESPSIAPRLALRRATETVLLVEDEDALRRVCARILRRAGYQVLEAADPAEATAVFEGRAEPIAVLVTDVILPGKSGPVLAAELTERRPGLRTLFLSGYAGEALARRGLPASAAFLEKPFTPDALIRKVHELIESGPVA